MAAGKIVTVLARDGSKVEFVKTANPPSGQMKYVYFSPQKDYVVAFFMKPLSPNAMERLEYITGQYKKELFEKPEGEFWKQYFCWPSKIVEWQDGDVSRVGIVMPCYQEDFFFKNDPRLKGKEKNGYWFASANRFRRLKECERGDFLKFLKICLNVSRAVRRLHSAGLAHSDLSYKNVLVDPCQGGACIIDVDGLVVPGKFDPDVLGTADFIAPEVLCDTKVLPSAETDLHALAVLIYMYLLHRHPLKGGRFFGPDVEDENKMILGLDPLYIEHPSDHRNKDMKREYYDHYEACLPWVDLNAYSAERITGSLLSNLFRRAFIEGLKNPKARPSAAEWEAEIQRTSERLIPCKNPACLGKWFVHENFSEESRCPYCGTKYDLPFWKFDFYAYDSARKEYVPENDFMIAFEGRGFRIWHVNGNVKNNEFLKLADQKRLAYCHCQNGTWYLVNERLSSLYEVLADGTRVKKNPGEGIALETGKRIILSDGEGGRMVQVNFIENK